jgi:hypothetical protein
MTGKAKTVWLYALLCSSAETKGLDKGQPSSLLLICPKAKRLD